MADTAPKVTDDPRPKSWATLIAMRPSQLVLVFVAACLTTGSPLLDSVALAAEPARASLRGGLQAKLAAGPAEMTRDALPNVFARRAVELENGVRISYLIGGKGPPVVLLHGWPETGYAWRKVMPLLVAAGYQVIVPDMRGFGSSSKPASGYDRLTMAHDIHRLVTGSLGLSTVFVVGHDWGGSTAAAWAGAHPAEVSKLVVIEAQPRGPWSGPEPWFYTLHRSAGFAEALVAGRERTYLTWFYRNFAATPDAITPSEINVYLRSYGSAAGMRPGFELVRALPRDVEANTAAARSPADMPVLAIGGDKGMAGSVASNLKPLFSNVREAVVMGAGHFVPEEQPDALSRLIIDFLDDRAR